MLALFCRQAFDSEPVEAEVSQEEIDYGFSVVACPDCDGTGDFEMPDGTTEECVCCKGQGKLPVSLV